MSGGSYCYISKKLSEQCAGKMYDDVMNEMIHDLCELLHDLEWSFDGDMSNKNYKKTLSFFKNKWIKENRKNDCNKNAIIKGIKDAIDVIDKGFIEAFATDREVFKVIAFYENKGYELIKFKKKKVVMYEPFSKKEINIYYKYNDDCTKKLFEGIRFK